VAACTSATTSGLGDMEVMSQPAPTPCIALPMSAAAAHAEIGRSRPDVVVLLGRLLLSWQCRMCPRAVFRRGFDPYSSSHAGSEIDIAPDRPCKAP
jgi:hypothetical protein